jgi:hypothetical protein
MGQRSREIQAISLMRKITYYLARNPDVAKIGGLKSGFDHFG